MKETFHIDEVLSTLKKQEKKLVIFCGAGISVNSGLPTVIPILDEILQKLEIDNEDKDKLIYHDDTLAMPFELFFETFLENTNDQKILEIFKDGEPSTNHFFISKCHQKNILNEVYTTNFDILIEKAFILKKHLLHIFKDEESFSELDTYTAKCKLVKLHGSIDNIESIRTTLSTVANKKLNSEREKAIERIFANSDEDHKILIIGYSCSDVFDIIPKIEKIFNPKIMVYLVDHNKCNKNKSDAIIEDISLQNHKNPFSKYKGLRIKVDTDQFIKWFWMEIDDDYESIKNYNSEWKDHIKKWIGSFHSSYLKYTIIGQLFYRISNFNLALKYHQKALSANDGSNSRGLGASYSNIGLIYHNLKEYEKAIDYYKQAYRLFDGITFLFGRAAAYTNMGYSYIYLNDKVKSLINLKKSLLISRKQEFRENRVCESDALNTMGLLYEKQAEFENSIYYYNLALDIDKEGNKPGEAQTLADIGRVFMLLGDYKKSIKHFKASCEIANKIGMSELIKYTTNCINEIRAKS